MLNDRSLAEQAIQMLEPNDFERDDAREIFIYAKQMLTESEAELSYTLLLNRLSNNEARRALSELPFYTTEEDAAESLQQRIGEIKIRTYEKELKKIHEGIRAAERNQDEEQLIKYQQMKMEIQRVIKNIKTKGVVVLP